jgi:hypothetical protein
MHGRQAARTTNSPLALVVSTHLARERSPTRNAPSARLQTIILNKKSQSLPIAIGFFIGILKVKE